MVFLDAILEFVRLYSVEQEEAFWQRAEIYSVLITYCFDTCRYWHTRTAGISQWCRLMMMQVFKSPEYDLSFSGVFIVVLKAGSVPCGNASCTCMALVPFMSQVVLLNFASCRFMMPDGLHSVDLHLSII
jgi:hypothetical protein